MHKEHKDKIVEAAQKLSECEAAVESLGMMNRPSDPVERVKADARYRIAVTARDKAADIYRGSLLGCTLEELREIADI